MNTLFTVRLAHPDPREAAQLAASCFRRLAELEDRLSRYRPDSEVSRINALGAGESLLISEDTHRCLQTAIAASQATRGLFDVTVGALTSDPDGGSLAGRLSLAPDRPLVTCEAPGRQLDLGGIGKGFALDELGRLLAGHEPPPALLSAGASGHLATGGWSADIRLTAEPGAREVRLTDRALSASGTGIQGGHVIDPESGAAPAYAFDGVWVLAPTAAEADALSTALLLLDEGGLREAASALGKHLEIYFKKPGESRITRLSNP